MPASHVNSLPEYETAALEFGPTRENVAQGLRIRRLPLRVLAGAPGCRGVLAMIWHLWAVARALRARRRAGASEWPYASFPQRWNELESRASSPCFLKRLCRSSMAGVA
jgi:hypothetical protein